LAGLRPPSVWWSIRWQGAALLLVVLLSVSVAVVLERQSGQSIQELIGAITRARTQANGAQQVLSAIQDVETGQCGFLLTGRAYYLEPFEQARIRVTTVLGRVSALAEGSPWLQDEAAPLGDLVRRKIAEMEQTVTLARAGQHQAALDLVLTDDG
jgi:CHASE3 domain sensor protein